MSDRAKTRSSTEPSGTVATTVADDSKNLSSSQASQSSSSGKLTIIDANEQLRGIRKLNTDYLSGTTEVNNNSIFAPGGASYISPHRMDAKRKTTLTSNNPSSGLILDSSATKVSLERSIESSQETRTSSTNQIPSYSSIFTSSSYRRSMSPPNQQQQHSTATKNSNVTSGNRTSSQRQLVESEIEIPVTTITGRLSNSNSGKKLPTFSYAKNSSSNENRDEDDDDDESNDNDFDERHPFNNSNMNTTKSAASRSNSNKRISSETHRCSSPCKHSVSACGHKCDASTPHHEHAAHTKISFNESRPPSFSLCQLGGYDNAFNRKLDWQDLPMCFKCDCSDCYKKRKAFMMRSEHHPGVSSTTYIEKYSRTKSVHLILKSVILVLLTLLLLMLLIGVILAGHFLPGVFDRLLNVSRSFNVTIAG